MANFHVSEHLIALKVELGETIFIEFQPDEDEMTTISFAVGTISLPGDRMALSIALPPAHTYQQKEIDGDRFILLHDVNEPKEITLELPLGDLMILEKVEND